MSNSLWPRGLQHTRLPCPSPAPGAYSTHVHPKISSSVIPFSSCLQSFPASGSLPMSQFFASGGQSIRVSASTSVLPMNIQDWLPLGLTGWISLQYMIVSCLFLQWYYRNMKMSFMRWVSELLFCGKELTNVSLCVC